MATQEHFLDVQVVLTDPAQVKALQEKYVGGQIGQAPYNPNGTPQPQGTGVAAFPDPLRDTDLVTLYNAPFKAGNAGLSDAAPYIYTTYVGDENVTAFPLDLWTFSKKVGGFFGLGGTTHVYYWRAQFSYQAPDTPTVDQVPVGADNPDTDLQEIAAISPRRWIVGFEFADQPTMEGLSSYLLGENACWDASRHPGQRGLALRGANQQVTMNLTDQGATPTNNAASWERFYVRVRTVDPLVGSIFWSGNGSTSTLAGAALVVLGNGKIAIGSLSTGGALALGASTTDPLPIGTWVKIDVLIDFDAGSCTAYMNGAQIGTVSFATTAGDHGSSKIGFHDACNHEMDVDDWINAEYPDKFTGLDWLGGSMVAWVRPTGLGASTSGFSGDYRRLAQLGTTNTESTEMDLASSTANALLEVTTDAGDTVDGEPGGQGAAAVLTAVRSKRGTSSGKLGASLAGESAVLADITELTSINGSCVLQTVDGESADLLDVTPLTLQYQKGNDTSEATVEALGGLVEIIGSFGSEDIRATEAPDGVPDTPVLAGIHNMPYPRSPWTYGGGAPPVSPVVIIADTYTGNGTGQDLTFDFPVHWFMCRKVGAASQYGGYRWWSTLQATHAAVQQGVEPWHIVRAKQNIDFQPADDDDTTAQQQYVIQISGDDDRSNADGETYEYVAVCDPGMRFMLNAQFMRATTLDEGEYLLPDGGFTPEIAHLWIESLDNTSTSGFGLKVPDHADDEFCLIGSSTVKSGLTFGAGKLTTSGSDLHAQRSIGLALWRRDDGSGDPGVHRVCTAGSYVGDGSTTRTIALTPASERRPLYAIVLKEGSSVGYFRDPKHQDNKSTGIVDTAEVTTGIRGGGIDQIIVGSSLNTADETYRYFVLFGGTDAGNDGWSQNGTFVPVDPADAPGDEWTVPTFPGGEEGNDEGEGDFSSTCEPFTRSLVNIALSRIGVTKQVADLVNEKSIEAALARLNVTETINAVLRDFPWPFATRYATLELVGGTATTPAVADWQYAYRQPDNCVFARRIVPPDGERRDPRAKPIRFRIGSDATGNLIYCDEPTSTDRPLVLEFTVRKDCPASEGDALFKDALIWRFAEVMAPALARDTKKQDYCRARYDQAIARAKVAAANEAQRHAPRQPDYIDARLDGPIINRDCDPWGRD